MGVVSVKASKARATPRMGEEVAATEPTELAAAQARPRQEASVEKRGD